MVNTSNTKKPTTPESTNPIKQVVDVMKKVETKGPEAKQNEVSIKDKNGNRIKLDDDEVRYNHFKGRFVRKNPATGEEENIK